MLRQLSGESKQQHERLMEETFNKKEALILIYKNKIKDEGKEIEVKQVVRSNEIGICWLVLLFRPSRLQFGQFGTVVRLENCRFFKNSPA
jgi:hypothetical protein